MRRVDLDELKRDFRYIAYYELKRKPLFLDGCSDVGRDAYDRWYYECNDVLFVPECTNTKGMATVDLKMELYSKYAYQSRQLEYEHRQANTDWFSDLRQMLYEYTETLKESAEIEWTPSLKDTTIFPIMTQEIQAVINKYSEIKQELEVNYGYIEDDNGERTFTACSYDIAKIKRKNQREVMQIRAADDSDDKATYIAVGNSVSPTTPHDFLSTFAYVLWDWAGILKKKAVKGVSVL